MKKVIINYVLIGVFLYIGYSLKAQICPTHIYKNSNTSVRFTFDNSDNNIDISQTLMITDCANEYGPFQPIFVQNAFDQVHISFGIDDFDLNADLEFVFNTGSGEIRCNYSQEGVVPPQEIPYSAVLGYCNSSVEKMITNAINDGNINIETDPLWQGDCGLESLIWRDAPVFIGSVNLDQSQIDPSEYLLGVKGYIRTEEFKICPKDNSWCDYVFRENYDLMPLSDVEMYIEKEKRLPGFASAHDLIANGMDVLSTVKSQQEKIEELFLHVLRLHQKLSELQEFDIKPKSNSNTIDWCNYNSIETESYTTAMETEYAPLTEGYYDINNPCEQIACDEIISYYPKLLNELILGTSESYSCVRWEGGSNCFNHLTLPQYRMGRVGIGTHEVPNGFRLAVDGRVVADRVRVELSEDGGWGDYVFYDDYDLISFSELSAFIDENGFLPGMPSEEVILEEAGVSLKQISMLQQVKIEELFLYLISIKNQIDKLSK